MAKRFLFSLSGLLTALGITLLVVAAIILSSSILGSKASNWAYNMTGARELKEEGFTGKGITIAIVDTGFDRDHPSLKRANVVAWKDYVNNRAEPYDDVGHGNHVAGIIVGSGSTFSSRIQGLNLEGAAPDAGLIIVKAIAADGSGSQDDVAAGVRFSIQEGADIICLSLGRRENPLDILGDDISRAIESALDAGIHVVAAAGNTGEDPDRDDVESPATIKDVIAVGAVDEDKRVASFSAEGNEEENYGTRIGSIGTPPGRNDPDKKPEVVAPGVGIRSAWKDGTYAEAKGTSQAAPFVCAGLALLLEARPNLRAVNSRDVIERVKVAVMKTAEDVPDQRTPHDPKAGYGLFRGDLLPAQF